MGPRGSILEPVGLSADVIRRELDKLLLKDELKLSNRNRRFLAFVVNETLEGRGVRIKAYAIGVDVLGRGDDFDPMVDPIVRIEATRIRAALATYYAGPGAEDLVHIAIPPGSYIPNFTRGRSAGPVPDLEITHQSAEPPTGPNSVAFVVTHFSDQRDRCAVSRGQLLIGAIVQRFSAAGCDVLLMSPTERRAPEKKVRPLTAEARSVYALDVTVHALAGAKRYDWRLTDLWNRRVGLSGSADHADDGHPSADMIDGLARRITEDVFSVAR